MSKIWFVLNVNEVIFTSPASITFMLPTLLPRVAFSSIEPLNGAITGGTSATFVMLIVAV